MNIYNCDCISGSKKYIKDNSIDLIICDPPFGISESKFDKHYKREDNIIVGYKEAPSDYLQFSKDWINESKRILKENGSMYIVSGWSNLGDIIEAIKGADLCVENHIIWKYNFGVYTKNKFVSSHYHILYIKKSKNSDVVFNRNCRFGDDEKDKNGRSLLYSDLEDVWVINKEYHQGKLKNQNKLPEALIEKMILYSSNSGDKVCDFFLGNFTTAVVAKKLGRIPYGFEINEQSFLIFNEELNNIKNGCRLRELREVPKSMAINRGKKISKNEAKEICKMYKDIRRIPTKNNKENRDKIMSKKDAINVIGEKFGRGYFSILNLLTKNNIK